MTKHIQHKRQNGKMRPVLQKPHWRQNLLLGAFTLLALSGFSVAHALMSQNLTLGGSVNLRSAQQVRIQEIVPSKTISGTNDSCGINTYGPSYTTNTITMEGDLPALNCTLSFDVVIQNDSASRMGIISITEILHNNPNVQYVFNDMHVNTVLEPGSQYVFQVVFQYLDTLTELPNQTTFGTVLSFAWQVVLPPVLTVSDSFRNYSLFKGQSLNIDNKVSALDDVEGDITSRITKTCTKDGVSTNCPNVFSGTPRGQYAVTYNVSNSFGLSATPVTIGVLVWDISKINGGTYHAIALTSHGRAYTWGYNTGGRLGLGDASRRLSPTLMITPTNLVDVAACDNSGHAVDSAGNLYSWGQGTYYSLGNNSTGSRSSPVTISPPSGEKYTQVSCYQNTGAALTESGHVYTWGWSGYGANGGGSSTDYRVPTRLTGLSNIVKVSMGHYNGAAIDATGKLFLWGSNSEGQLGVGSSGSVSSRGVSNYYNTPKNYNYVTDAKDICIGTYHMVLVKTNGQVQTWGSNNFGRLGNGSSGNDSFSPYTTPITGAVSCSADLYGSAVVTSSGRVYFFGGNNFGEMGLGYTSTAITTPTVTSAYGVVDAAMQLDSSHMLVDNAVVYGVGYNGNGELGIGNASNTTARTPWNFTPPAIQKW